jgi:hypothetical protein
MARLGYALMQALAHCAIPALAAALVIQTLNYALGRTLMSPLLAAAGGAMGSCLLGLINSLEARRQDH